jgi:hypothetical protein
MHRYSSARSSSAQGFDVRPLHVCDTADLRVAPQLIHAHAPSLPCFPQRLERDVETDLVAKFKAIGDRLCDAKYLYRRTANIDLIDALARLANDGRLVRVSRVLYALPDRTGSEYDSLAEVSAKTSAGVICLISAPRLHELTTQQSAEIWLLSRIRRMPLVWRHFSINADIL